MLLAGVMALTLVVGMTGCGKKEEPKQDATKTEKKEEPKKEEKKDDANKEIKGDLNVFAAASLKISLEKIVKDFNQKYPDVKVVLNTNGSDKLRTQIKEGAPCDLFISANKKQMDNAIEDGTVDAKDSKDFLKNEVVLIRYKDAPDIKLADLKDGKDLCLGEESVPVGRYSKQYFEKTGQWDALKGTASFETQVTNVVKKVAAGEAKYGLVYQTDANSEIKNGTIAVCDKIPADSGIKVIYPMAITKDAKNLPAAEAFRDFLHSSQATDVLEDVGFVIIK